MGITTHDIEMVREKYPMLEISKRERDYVFAGELILNHVFDDVRMTGKFNLEIVVPGDFPLAFPNCSFRPEISSRLPKPVGIADKTGLHIRRGFPEKTYVFL